MTYNLSRSQNHILHTAHASLFIRASWLHADGNHQHVIHCPPAALSVSAEWVIKCYTKTLVSPKAKRALWVSGVWYWVNEWAAVSSSSLKMAHRVYLIAEKPHARFHKYCPFPVLESCSFVGRLLSLVLLLLSDQVVFASRFVLPSWKLTDCIRKIIKHELHSCLIILIEPCELLTFTFRYCVFIF